MYTNGANIAILESIRNIYNTALERSAGFWLMRRELPSLRCNNSVSVSKVDIYLVGTKSFVLLSEQLSYQYSTSLFKKCQLIIDSENMITKRTRASADA